MTYRACLAHLCLQTLLIGLAVGCSQDDAVPTGTPESKAVVVTGLVLRIDDGTPSDGGVILDLKLDFDGLDRAYLPSFFTVPPPPPEQQEAYEIIRTLDVGDRIRVEGERTDNGIKIGKVTRLE